MATCTHAIGTADTGATPNTSGAFTPAVGDLLVAFVVASGTIDAFPNNLVGSTGMVFEDIISATYAAGGLLYAFVSTTLVSSATSQTVTFNPADGATGTIIYVCRVAGMSRTGTDAVRQSRNQDLGTAATTPAPVFLSAALTSNPVLGCVGNSTNPAGMTPPSGWTEGTADLGYANPTTGGEYAFINSGFTGTTVTWGSTSASIFGAVILELDSSVPAAEDVMPYIGGGYY